MFEGIKKLEAVVLYWILLKLEIYILLFVFELPLIQSFWFVTVSGLTGTKETAQSQVSVGMGLLAGSTVMLSTVIWGTCVVVGKCDLRESDSVAMDGRNMKGLSLTGI